MCSLWVEPFLNKLGSSRPCGSNKKGFVFYLDKPIKPSWLVFVCTALFEQAQWRSTLLCYILNIMALGHVVSDNFFLYLL